jgi:phosphodiesterase/alkaline phosphatase D-like protein
MPDSPMETFLALWDERQEKSFEEYASTALEVYAETMEIAIMQRSEPTARLTVYRTIVPAIHNELAMRTEAGEEW